MLDKNIIAWWYTKLTLSSTPRKHLTFYIKDATVLTTGTKWKYPQLYFTVRMVLVVPVRWLQSLNMQNTFSKSEIAWQIFDGRWSAVRTLQPFCTVWRYHPVEGVACRLSTSIFSTTWLPSIMVLKLHVFRGIIFTCTWESSLHFNTMSLPFVLVFQRPQVK